MKMDKNRRRCPNPLFEKWLLEWRDEARTKGSTVEHHFTKAITSLQKYPLCLKSGRECIILQHFGTKLCTMLDRKLKSHYTGKTAAHTSDIEDKRTRNDVENDILSKKSKSMERSSTPAEFELGEKIARKKKKKVPSPIARRRDHSLSSSDLDSPIIEIPDIDDLCSKKIVSSKNKDKAVSALRPKIPVDDNNLPKNGTEGTETLLIDQFHILPNKFDVLLLVDTHETGSKTKSKDDAVKSALNGLSVPYEIRHLKIGDFCWIARCRETNRELILPYIVERKRMDDLAASIKDRRFHEQKFRLKQSGIPNIIYMIESHGNNHHIGLPLPTLLQAATNTLVQEDFTVKFTNNHRESMRYLSILTTQIHKLYKEKQLVCSKKEDLGVACISSSTISLMEFERFNKAASKVKTFKVKEMFIRQLLQLKGLSLEKALAIVELYPTPTLLVRAFKNAGNNANKLLATIQAGAPKRQLGPVVSKVVFELYTKKILS